MLFSILVANYNNGHFFIDCYNSILSQSYSNWEVVLVDDGSNDDSTTVIKDIIGNDDRFRFYENTENKGCGFTKARCAQLANGKIMGFLDPDDCLYPEALTTMVEAFNKNRSASIITSNYEFVNLHMICLSKGSNAGPIPKGKSYLIYGKGALTAFACFTKKAYDKSEGINPVMKRAVDQDLYYKMEEQGEHFFLNKVLYKYRVNKNSISQNNNIWKAEYWHFYAQMNAFKRRNTNDLSIANFSKDHIKKHQVDYYLKRFEKLKFSKKRNSKYYFLCRSFMIKPFYRFRFKIKSFVLVILNRI
jgi:glycosyltransferase involved in cell wall biosynthesis